jgi:hypothetical protein
VLFTGADTVVSFRPATRQCRVADAARFGTIAIASWSLLAFSLAAFLALTAWRGRLLHVDDIFYKAAGYHWSAQGEFAAPELVGRLAWDPPIETVFACYPPLYPFVFGVYTNVVGFGWRQVAMFDALLHAALCLATALLVPLMFRLAEKIVGAHKRPDDDHIADEAGSFPAWLPHVLACAAGLIVLPLGTIGRPDELAMLLAIAGLALAAAGERPNPLRRVAVGALWGLCAATSIGTAVIMAPMILLLLTPSSRRLRPAQMLGDIAVLVGVAGLVFAACWIPLVRIHPLALRQFIEHSRANTNDDLTFVQAWAEAFHSGTQLMLTMTGSAITAVLLGVLSRRIGLLRLWACLLGGAIVGLLMTLFAAKGKPTYVWFVGPWMISAALVLGAWCWRRVAIQASELRDIFRAPLLPWAAAASLVLAPMLLAAGVAGAVRVTQWLAVAALPPGQTPADAQIVLDHYIPDGAVVLADDLWPQLAGRCQVYDATFSLYEPERVLDRVEYVALTANHSDKPGQRRRLRREDLEQYLNDHFEVVCDQAGRNSRTILGGAVDANTNGFGPVLLRRRSASEDLLAKAGMGRARLAAWVITASARASVE